MASYQLHWVDYVVFLVVLLVTSGIGALFALTGSRQTTTAEYFTGNRQLKVLPTSLSIVVTYMSAVMVIGIPAEAYSYGADLILGAVAEPIGICLTAVVIVPVLYPLKLLSVNKYLEMRYNSPYPKLFATGLAVVQTTMYAAVVLIAPSTAISSFLGIPVWSVIIISATLAIFYTTIGGIKAVIWSDAFLCVCMLSGMLLMCVQGVKYAGGLSAAYSISLEGERLNVFNFSPDPTERLTVWSALIGITFNGFGVYGTLQPILQRYSNVTSLNKAKLTLLIAILGVICMYIIPISTGLSIYAYYKHKGCDPIKAKIIDGQNQLVPHFIMEVLNFPGIPGLFIASLAAGSLSSVSSVLNSSAANLWDDLLQYKLPGYMTKKGSVVSKIIVLMMGIVTTLLSFILMVFGGTIFQLSVSVNSITMIPIVGMVLQGIFCPWINAKGILTGGICGMLFIIWLVFGQYFNTIYTTSELPTDTTQCNTTFTEVNQSMVNYSLTTFKNDSDFESNRTFGIVNEGSNRFDFLNWLYSISYIWYITFGNIIIFIVGTIVSLATGWQKLHPNQKNLISRCYRNIYFVSSKEKSTGQTGETEQELIALKDENDLETYS